MLTLEQLENVEEIEGEDDDARRERGNAQEEKDIMEVLIEALGHGGSAANGSKES